MSLKIIKSYGQTSVFAAPAKLRKFGVPPGGPIDPHTPGLVRAALLSEDDSPVLEVLGTLEFEAKRDLSICWMTPHAGFVKRLKKFERFRVTTIGSFAGYLGYSYRPMPERKLAGLFEPVRQLRFLPLEQRIPFDASSTLDINRQGYRFNCELSAKFTQSPSEPAVPGLIQQTPGGQIIILGPDGPVSGGYRRLGVVIAADWPYLAQISVNSDYEFIPVNREIAIHALKDVRRAVAVRSQFLRIIQQRETAKAS